jgi:nitroreductase
MTIHGATNSRRLSPHPQRLTPNEEAILDSVRLPLLKRLLTAIWRVKLRLQFTGWLQYLPAALLALALLLIAAVFHILGVAVVGNAFLGLGSLLLLVDLFDVVTVKFRLRFREALPKRNDDLETFDLLRARRSCRSFQTRKLTPADLDELMAFVNIQSKAPTIGDSPVRLEYVSAPLTVWPTVNATEFLVAIAPKKYNRLTVIDVGRNLQKVVIKATRMGLGTCWIGPGADQASVARHLGDRFNPDDDHIICVCAIGYKSNYLPMFLRIFNMQFQRRLPFSSLFFADPSFEEPLNVDAPPFRQFGRTFEVCQWSPSSYNGQTTRCVAVTDHLRPDVSNGLGDEVRLVRFDFYASTASRYYAAVAVGIWCADWEMGCDALGIHGHFAVLTPEQRGLAESSPDTKLPRYDLSWLPEDNLATT